MSVFYSTSKVPAAAPRKQCVPHTCFLRDAKSRASEGNSPLPSLTHARPTPPTMTRSMQYARAGLIWKFSFQHRHEHTTTQERMLTSCTLGWEQGKRTGTCVCAYVAAFSSSTTHLDGRHHQAEESHIYGLAGLDNLSEGHSASTRGQHGASVSSRRKQT